MLLNFNGESSSPVMPQIKKTIMLKQLQWNFRSCFFRFLFIALVCFLFLWVFAKFDSSLLISLLAIRGKSSSDFPSSAATSSLNFTIAFSNVRKDYEMEVPSSEPCAGKHIKMLVLIMSRRDTVQKRQGIRQSWAADAPDGVLIRFVLGDPLEGEVNSTQLDVSLVDEQRQFGDLIRYGIEDGYANLHFKMSAAFQWQQKWCADADFVMKTDDDTIVDLTRWEYWTERKFNKDIERFAPNRTAFFGFLIEGSTPIREKGHKWYVPVEHFHEDVYPNYMLGATYFGTGAAIQAVMAHTREVVGFNMDDIVFTGTLAEKANVSRFQYGEVHFRGGNNLQENEACEEGHPLVFAFYRNFKNAAEFVVDYGKLHNLKCK